MRNAKKAEATGQGGGKQYTKGSHDEGSTVVFDARASSFCYLFSRNFTVFTTETFWTGETAIL